MTQFTIGFDPEVFVTEKGKGVSAHGMINGTKESPFPTEVGAVQVDGMALEFNTTPVPVGNFEAMNRNLVKTMDDMKKLLLKHGEETGRKLNIKPVPVMEFTEEYLANQPDEAKELGCDPDYNAYTLEPNPRPDGERNFRTGAGHIHIGWGADIPQDHPDHIKICADFVKQLDRTVGIFMTAIETDGRRRELYGKAGAFRPKSYGVEYRTPSNEWLISKSRRKMVHWLVNQAINLHRYSGNFAARTSQEEIVRIIDQGVRGSMRYFHSIHLRGRVTPTNRMGWSKA